MCNLRFGAIKTALSVIQEDNEGLDVSIKFHKSFKKNLVCQSRIKFLPWNFAPVKTELNWKNRFCHCEINCHLNALPNTAFCMFFYTGGKKSVNSDFFLSFHLLL